MRLIRLSKADIALIDSKLSALAADTRKWQRAYNNPSSWMNETVYQVFNGKPVAKALKEAILLGGGNAVYVKEVPKRGEKDV